MNNEGTNLERNFRLRGIKLTHYYFNGSGINHGDLISTSVELYSEKDFENNRVHWYRVVTTEIKNNTQEENDCHVIKEEIPIKKELIEQIENIDLPHMKNNYYTDSEPEKFECWAIEYNYHFKIYGTRDQLCEEYEFLSELLDFEDIIKNKLNYYKEITNGGE